VTWPHPNVRSSPPRVLPSSGGRYLPYLGLGGVAFRLSCLALSCLALPLLSPSLISFHFGLFIFLSLPPSARDFVPLLLITNSTYKHLLQLIPLPKHKHQNQLPHQHHQYACLRVLLPVWRHDCHQHHLHRLWPQAVQQLPSLLNAQSWRQQFLLSPLLLSPFSETTIPTRWESKHTLALTRHDDF
jgi:hypothetical protein